MKHVSESIAAYLGGELDTESAQAVREHLETCADCRAEFEASQEVWALLDRAASQEAAGPSVWPAVRARTVAGSSFGADWFFGRGPLTRAGWAAAAVAAGVMLGALLPGAGSVDGSGGTALAAEDGTGWLEASWLDSSNTGEVLADQWLAAGLDEQENGS